MWGRRRGNRSTEEMFYPVKKPSFPSPDQKGLEDEEKVGVIPHDDVRPDPDEVKPPKKEKGLFITEAIAMEREECAKIADRHDKTIGEAGRGERRFLDGVKQGRDPNSRKELPNSKATISG